MSDYIRNLRNKIGHERIIIPTTACIILNQKGEILLQCRSGNDTWGCPGGLMDLEETVLESVGREVYEETGLRIKNPVLLGVYSGSRYKATYPNGDKTQSVLMVFMAKEYSGILSLDAESTALKFFPLSNLPEPLNQHHSEYLAHYKEYVEGRRDIPVVF